MGRTLKVAAAQLGPVHLTSKREETVQRVIALLESAAAQGVQILLFPEIVFVTFFPRHLIEDQKELDKFVECDDDLIKSPNTNLLFDKAKEFGVDISVGYAERAGYDKGYNTSVYYSVKEGKIVSKYRKNPPPRHQRTISQPRRYQPARETIFHPRKSRIQSL